VEGHGAYISLVEKTTTAMTMTAGELISKWSSTKTGFVRLLPSVGYLLQLENHGILQA
jgi:hypothetical protein